MKKNLGATFWKKNFFHFLRTSGAHLKLLLSFCKIFWVNYPGPGLGQADLIKLFSRIFSNLIFLKLIANLVIEGQNPTTQQHFNIIEKGTRSISKLNLQCQNSIILTPPLPPPC